MKQATRIAVLGSGGKTTALAALAALHRTDRVLLTTTTHIFPFSDCDRLCLAPTADELTGALSVPGVVCAGVPAASGKLTRLPDDVLDAASRAADWIFYEADGSKRLPLKLHAPTEPVMLPDTAHGLVIAGLSALGRPIEECVHRYQLRADWAGRQTVDAAVIAACVRDAVQACGLPHARLTVLLNQLDAVTDRAPVYALVRTLEAEGLRCIPCSLREGIPPDWR